VMPDEAIRPGQRTIEHDTRLEQAETPRGAAITRCMLAAMQSVINTAGKRPRVAPIFALRLAAADSAVAAFEPRTATAFAELAAKAPVWFDPTLVVVEALFRKNEPEIRNPAEPKYAPKAAREFDELGPPKPNPTAADLEDGLRRWRDTKRSLEPLIKGGVKIIAGTDVPVLPLIPGF